MKIHQSAEDYLETILVLKKRLGTVRSIDIAHELNFSKPSVSVAMKKLRENGYISTLDDGSIVLEPSGLEVANRVYTRHKTLISLFTRLGVSAEIAEQDACQVEHILNAETMECIQAFLDT